MNFISRLKVPRKTFIGDMVSGLIMSIVTVPGALANAQLAAVNPIYGVYSVIAGTTVAAAFTSSVIMNVDSTSATAIATSDFLRDVPADQQLSHLVVLGIIVGVFMLAFGLLKLGFYDRYPQGPAAAESTGHLAGSLHDPAGADHRHHCPGAGIWCERQCAQSRWRVS